MSERPSIALPATAAALAVDPWGDLRRFTAARLAIGRVGGSLPTAEVLGFGLAHAQARDAVHLPLDVGVLESELRNGGWATQRVSSAAVDRAAYLARPDLGRRLAATSAARLDALAAARDGAAAPPIDLLVVVADGLSSLAIARHAPPLLAAIRAATPGDWHLGPVMLATQARVALADEIGERLHVGLVAMLIGERPGLSSPDSLGIYLTWQPRRGRNDAERNCISNVRPEGLPYTEAARKLWWLCQEARRLRLSGVDLKDCSDEIQIDGARPAPLQA